MFIKNKIIMNSRFLTQRITGVQRFAIEISKQLKKQLGDKVQFVSPKNIVHSELAKELDVTIIGDKTGHLWEQINLPNYLKKNNSPLLLNLANTAPLFYKNKIVTVYDLAFYHHPEWFSKKFTLFYNFLIPKILKNSRHILTDSNYVKNDISKSYNIEKEKITTIYGSYSDIFKKNIEEKERFALAVGSIDPRKNLTALIDVFMELKNIKLVIVGQKNKVFSSLNITKLSKNIVFTGYVDDDELVALYNKATIFIYPSFFEGFGIPPLEAQSCGCPVISSNTTSLSEVGANSFLYCNPYDISDMKNKVLTLMEDDKLKKQLIQAGFDNIRRFSWEKSAKKIIEVIEGLR